MSIGQTIVYSGQLFEIVESYEAVAGVALKLLGSVVVIPPKVQVADVMFNLAGGEQVSMCEKDFAGPKTAFYCLVITAQHRQPDRLGQPGSRRRMVLAKREQCCLGRVQVRDRRLHLSCNQSGDATSPLCKGADLQVVPFAFGEFREEGERRGSPDRARWLSSPVGLADLLQRVRKFNVRQRRVVPEQCLTFRIARIDETRRQLCKLHPDDPRSMP